MKLKLLLFTLIINNLAFSQDSIRVDTFNPMKIDINNVTYNLKITNGIQKHYFFEIGLSRCSFVGSGHGMFGTAYGITYSIFPSFTTNRNSVQGVKLNGEFWGNMCGLGLDLAYYKSGSLSDVLIAPKFLIGVSNVNFYYAYNFSTQNYAIPEIGKHAFGLQINLPFFGKDRLEKTSNWGLKIYKSARKKQSNE